MPHLSLGPFAPLSHARHTSAGCRVLGIVEDDAVDLGLVLGLVLEVEEDEEERGLVVLLEVVLVSRGFVPRSGRALLTGFHFGVVLARVLVEV